MNQFVKINLNSLSKSKFWKKKLLKFLGKSNVLKSFGWKSKFWSIAEKLVKCKNLCQI